MQHRGDPEDGNRRPRSVVGSDERVSAVFAAALVAVLALARPVGAMQLPGCTEPLARYGAVGDGSTDDAEAIRRALRESECFLEGGGLTYAVAGSLRTERDMFLRNATFVQLAPGPPDIRTIHQTGGVAYLQGLTVQRGTDPAGGSIRDAAGIWLAQPVEVDIRDVRVTGDGKGSGIRVIAATGPVRIKGVRIDDMLWHTTEEPSHEQLVGLWVYGGSDVRIEDIEIARLGGTVGGTPVRYYQTDGITLTGTRNLRIADARISQVGEGIDFTGSDGNSDFEVTDSIVYDADSFGFKFANSAVRGMTRDSKAVRCGYAGFIASGPTEANLPLKTSDIVFLRDTAIDTGANRRWSQFQVSGFFILEGSYDLDFPRNVRVVDSRSIQSSAATATKFGFLNRVMHRDARHANVVANVDSVGHTVEGGRGMRGAPYSFAHIERAYHEILGCRPRMDAQLRWFDEGAYHGWTLERLGSELTQLRRHNDLGTCAQ